LANSGGASYDRVLLKISGEAFAGEDASVDVVTTAWMAEQIAEVARLGVSVAVVVGGGNIWRGKAHEAAGMDRANADYMGMLATVINALALQDALERIGVASRVQTAIQMQQIAEPYIRRRAMRHLEKGRVVIFGAGTGNPYFTTDTTAARRPGPKGAPPQVQHAGAARRRDRRASDSQGDQGRRYLHRGSEDRSAGHASGKARLSRSAAARVTSYG
jgi:hypothetical protein